MNPDETGTRTGEVRTSISVIDDAHRALEVEVPADQMASEYEDACRTYARRLKVPGFRQGKVPLHIIRQRFGREIEQETVERAIENAMRHALGEARPRPLRAPVLRKYDYSRGGPLTFRAEYEVMPRVQVRGADRVKVKEAEPVVTETMVGEALESLRDRSARFDPVVDRGVAPGDHVVLDATADIAGGGGRVLERENSLIEIGSGGPLPELSDPMKGMKPGETRRFTVDYKPDHPSREVAGRSVEFQVTVREIKSKVLPDLDDEFARDLGKFETLSELKNKIFEDLRSRETRRVREEARRQVIDQLLEHNPDVAVPDVLVEEEVDRRVQELARSMAAQGLDPATQPIDWDEIRQKQRDPATRSVQATILLDALAEEQKIELGSGALDDAIEREAQRLRQTADALRAKLTKDGRLQKLSEHLLREKVLDFLLTASNT